MAINVVIDLKLLSDLYVPYIKMLNNNWKMILIYDKNNIKSLNFLKIWKEIIDLVKYDHNISSFKFSVDSDIGIKLNQGNDLEEILPIIIFIDRNIDVINDNDVWINYFNNWTSSLEDALTKLGIRQFVFEVDDLEKDKILMQIKHWFYKLYTSEDDIDRYVI